jgi:hypothetical protein
MPVRGGGFSVLPARRAARVWGRSVALSAARGRQLRGDEGRVKEQARCGRGWPAQRPVGVGAAFLGGGPAGANTGWRFFLGRWAGALRRGRAGAFYRAGRPLAASAPACASAAKSLRQGGGGDGKTGLGTDAGLGRPLLSMPRARARRGAARCKASAGKGTRAAGGRWRWRGRWRGARLGGRSRQPGGPAAGARGGRRHTGRVLGMAEPRERRPKCSAACGAGQAQWRCVTKAAAWVRGGALGSCGGRVGRESRY